MFAEIFIAKTPSFAVKYHPTSMLTIPPGEFNYNQVIYSMRPPASADGVEWRDNAAIHHASVWKGGHTQRGYVRTGDGGTLCSSIHVH